MKAVNVPDLKICKLYYEDSLDYLVQYRGNFLCIRISIYNMEALK
jgi:hypothetical protein